MPVIKRIASHFDTRHLRGYALGKMAFDPVYPAAFELLKDSPLPVLDVGCGIGLLEFYLRERGFTAPLFGVDFDAHKIAQARRVAKRIYRDIFFTAGDVLGTPNFSGQVVLFDVLHYLAAERQRCLLEHLAERVAPGGLCLVRATLRDRSWRFQITRAEEFFMRMTGWMKSPAIHYPSAAEVLAPFAERGFSCAERPLWGRTPFNSHLFTFRRSG